MTKNLFLLFSIYFFVLQAIIIGLLTGNPLFYQIGSINAGAIILISILYVICTPSDPSKEKEKKHVPTPIVKPEPAKITPEITPSSETPTEKIQPIAEKQEKPAHKESLAEKPTHQVQVLQPVPTTAKKRKKA